MPGFSSRIQNALETRISALLDDIENPSETLDYTFERQRELLANVRGAIEDVLAAKRRLKTREDALRARVTELDEQVRRELANSQDEIAAAALAAKVAIQKEVDTLDDQIDDLDAEHAELTKKEQELEARLNELRAHKEATAAKAVIEKAEAARGGVGAEMTDLGNAMQRALGKAGTMGERADAVEAVDAGPTPPEVDPIRRLAQLEQDRFINDELERLRREIRGDA